MHTLDVTNEEAVTALFQDVESVVGAIDIIVNAAGHLSDGSQVVDSTLANFWNSFEVQVKGTFLMVRQFLRRHGSYDPIFISLNSLVSYARGCCRDRTSVLSFQ